MKVTVKRVPVAPIESITLELSLEDAAALKRLLGDVLVHTARTSYPSTVNRMRTLYYNLKNALRESV
jgi:hypothetical protein